ncbi:MAG: HAD family hydrolase [Daejeonella sp.]
MKSEHLVLFDFDGTLTTRDTLFEFCRFYAGCFKFMFGLLILTPILMGQRLKLISTQRAKEIFMNYFIGGLAITQFNEVCQKFTNHLANLIRSKAMVAIEDYRKKNARIIIVSASPENWILPWAEKYGIEVIATRLQVVNGSLTGKISGRNCNGIEKVNRINAVLTISDYPQITAYGDSGGDKQMLALAHKKFFKPFR